MPTQETSDSSFPSPHSKAKRLSVILALCYLALPNILFCLGWLMPIPALIVSCTIIFLVCHISRNCSPQWKFPDNDRTSKNAQIGSFLLIVVAMLLGGSLLIIGQQHSDYLARNPIFSSLVRCDWPIILPDQSYFVYYLTAWLPPSLLGRLYPNGDVPFVCQFIWIFLGIAIMINLMAKHLSKRVFLFIALLLLITQLGGVTPYQQMLAKAEALFGMSIGISPLDLYMHALRPLGTAYQLNSIINHIVSIWILLALFSSKALNWQETLCASSLCILFSPFGAAGLFVLLVFQWITEKRTAFQNITQLFKNPSFYSGILIVAVGLLYFLCSGEGGSFKWIWDVGAENHAGLFEFTLAFMMGEGFAAIFILVIAHSLGELKNKFVWFLIGFLPLLSVCFIGLHNNELLFKGSAVYFWILAYLMVQWLPKAGKKQKILIFSFVCLSSVNTFGNFYKALAPALTPKFSLHEQIKSQHIRAESQWHLYHPEHEFYPQFKGEVKHKWLFLDRAGASADTFFGWCRTNTHSDREILPPPSPWVGKDQ